MEVSALKRAGSAGVHGRSPLLRLQSDERLIALIRRGNHHAFEALVSRYQSRLLAFCRHMLSSREDAEDVLQEVFAAAFNAILADERAINVRPWLYRIARNRSLNHLRRTQAIGVDSMDVHLAEHGITTADKVHKREEFRLLMEDVGELPETQRTALLLREIDALSYEQIAEAMETTVPSVKSLLVRARVSLAEAAEARTLTCEDVRLELAEVAEGLRRSSSPVRRHVRTCERCQAFKKSLRATNRALAVMLPVAPALLLKKTLLAHIGLTAAAGGGAAATATGGGAAAGAAAGGLASGVLQAGAGALATKAVAGLAAAALVTAGAVEVKHVASKPAPRAVAALSAPARVTPVATPVPTAVTTHWPAATTTDPTIGDDAGAAAADPTREKAGTKGEDDDARAAEDPTAAATPTPTPATDPTAPPVLPPVTQHISDVTGLPADVDGLVLTPVAIAPTPAPGAGWATAPAPPPATATPVTNPAPPPATATPAPTTDPVATPTPAPTTDPVATPTPAPTTDPVATPTPAPTTDPVATPTPAPTTDPVATATPAPTPTADPAAAG
jgi:RNA polymerase sigma factor (sigma-70 family)